jgi:hypothetical protein
MASFHGRVVYSNAKFGPYFWRFPAWAQGLMPGVTFRLCAHVEVRERSAAPRAEERTKAADEGRTPPLGRLAEDCMQREMTGAPPLSANHYVSRKQ